MTRGFVTLVLLSMSTVLAQEPGVGILPVVPAQWDSIRQYLALTEAQVSALEQTRQNRIRDEQTIYRQIAEKQRQMQALLQQGSNDSLAIGRLMVDINNLNRQLPLNKAPYRTEALAHLTAEQKAKLPSLSEALKLQTAGWQAIELSMIDNPVVLDPRMLPMPVEPSGGAASEKGPDAFRKIR